METNYDTSTETLHRGIRTKKLSVAHNCLYSPQYEGMKQFSDSSFSVSLSPLLAEFPSIDKLEFEFINDLDFDDTAAINTSDSISEPISDIIETDYQNVFSLKGGIMDLISNNVNLKDINNLQ